MERRSGARKSANTAPTTLGRRVRIGSAVWSAAVGAGKLVLAVFERSYFVSVYGFYALAVAFSKALALRGETAAQGDRNRELKYYAAVGATLAAAAACYIVYSARLFFYPETFLFDKIGAIGIAAVSFTELIAASVGLSRANRRGDLMRSARRIVSLASAFSAIALTQTALLALGGAEASFPSALGGVVFGAASFVLSAAMLARYFRARKTGAGNER